MGRRLTLEEAIERARGKHGNKYDYNVSTYVNYGTKTKIKCNTCGNVFEQTWGDHLRGRGCPDCGIKKRANSRKLTLEEITIRAKEVHEDKYDYSISSYTGYEHKSDIKCNTCGNVFRQRWSNHLNGNGCPVCAKTQRTRSRMIPIRIIIQRAKDVHEDKYDYSNSTYEGIKTKTTIICRRCGTQFLQTWGDHLSGHGCPHCWKDEIGDKLRMTLTDAIDKAKDVHRGKYSYHKCLSYRNAKGKATVICRTCNNEFKQTWDNHLRGHGCPICGKIISQPELDVIDFIRSFYTGEIITNTREIIKPKELDIYLPEKNLAVEFNGCIWHSTRFKEGAKWLHWNKTEACQKLGIRLIHVFEDDWLYRQEQVKDILKHAILGPERTIYGRKTRPAVINVKTSDDFLERFHIQGRASASEYLGLEYEGQLVAVCLFKKRPAVGEYELVRYAGKSGTSVLGGLSKCLKFFLLRNPEVETVVSFCDRSLFSGMSYQAAGFKMVGVSDPDYKYITNGDCLRLHKFGFRRAALAKMPDFDFDPKLSEVENTRKNGWYQVFNAGLVKYIYEVKK